jgi:hypothetical protein
MRPRPALSFCESIYLYMHLYGHEQPWCANPRSALPVRQFSPRLAGFDPTARRGAAPVGTASHAVYDPASAFACHRAVPGPTGRDAGHGQHHPHPDLEIMGRHGWIVKRRSKDRWERRLGLAGQAQLKRALPRSGEVASPTPAATRPRALGHSDLTLANEASDASAK